jgi:hypothetical protein
MTLETWTARAKLPSSMSSVPRGASVSSLPGSSEATVISL